ncbi:hypothetical protein N7486_005805 [Penicillium sp. IBT 16267x]|nr:hypothetical protein N7486_005805 [Penicillium sp. IBT 16267x]
MTVARFLNIRIGVREIEDSPSSEQSKIPDQLSIAETYGGKYHSTAGGNDIIYIDDITYPEYGPVGHNTNLTKRQTYDYSWMQLNLYWDWWGNWYVASWETNVNCFTSEAYGWNSYLGCIGYVNHGTCADTIDDGNYGTIVSNTLCDLWPESNLETNGWCNPVGYTPGTLWAYVYTGNNCPGNNF